MFCWQRMTRVLALVVMLIPVVGIAQEGEQIPVTGWGFDGDDLAVGDSTWKTTVHATERGGCSRGWYKKHMEAEWTVEIAEDGTVLVSATFHRNYASGSRRAGVDYTRSRGKRFAWRGTATESDAGLSIQLEDDSAALESCNPDESECMTARSATVVCQEPTKEIVPAHSGGDRVAELDVMTCAFDGKLHSDLDRTLDDGALHLSRQLELVVSMDPDLTGTTIGARLP